MDTNDLTPHVLATLRRDMTDLRRDMTDLRADMETGFNRADARMDRMEGDMKAGFEQLGSRITETEIRLATAVNDLAGTLHDVHRLLQDRFGRRKLPDN